MMRKLKILFKSMNSKYSHWILIRNYKCPFCNASLKFTQISNDGFYYVCKKCKNTMPCGGGGAGVPDVVFVAHRTSKELKNITNNGGIQYGKRRKKWNYCTAFY